MLEWIILIWGLGGGLVCRRLYQNTKQSDPGHLSNLFYILCGHFVEKKTRGTP